MLASIWKSAQKLAFSNRLRLKAPATKKADNVQVTINGLTDHLLALGLVALTMEKSADMSMFLVAANYPSKQISSKFGSLNPNDVINLCHVSTIMTAGAVIRVKVLAS